MILFADEAVEVANATTTATSALIISICTLVVVPMVTLFIQKWADGRKQSSEAATAKAKLDADAVVARATIESEASIARAKLELDSKLTLISSQHQECMENHAKVEAKLDECEKQHITSAEDRAEMNRKIEKFEAYIQKREERIKEFEAGPAGLQ